MNILPKKRWHVRTKENIARVRRDEAEAAEKERQENLRIENADREARLNVLKLKSKEKLLEKGIIDTEHSKTSIPSGHVDLFADFNNAIQTTNKEHDKDIKKKQEEYEKKIGYLTYLGQDTNEALKKKNWYEVLPEESRFLRSSAIKDTYEKLVLKDDKGIPKIKSAEEKDGEVGWKSKQREDPFNLFKKNGNSIRKIINSQKTLSEQLVKTNNNKEKHKNDKPGQDKLKNLREARLKREREEKLKTLRYLSGQQHESKVHKNGDITNYKVKAKYNSQFNPELARQNYIK